MRFWLRWLQTLAHVGLDEEHVSGLQLGCSACAHSQTVQSRGRWRRQCCPAALQTKACPQLAPHDTLPVCAKNDEPNNAESMRLSWTAIGYRWLCAVQVEVTNKLISKSSACLQMCATYAHCWHSACMSSYEVHACRGHGAAQPGMVSAWAKHACIQSLLEGMQELQKHIVSPLSGHPESNQGPADIYFGIYSQPL